MTSSEDWAPPEAPDAQAILHEAATDARAGSYATALAKHIWFHEHALECDQGLFGVRVSFAVRYWKDLADAYPPAMTALCHARATAELRFREQGFEFSEFQDLAALNRVLGEQHRTVEAFKFVHDTDRHAALSVFHVALPFLILNGELTLCGMYLETKRDLESAIEIFKRMLEHESEREHSSPIPLVARNHFVHRVTTLVALLVRNGRIDDAEWVCAMSKRELDDEEFRVALAAALTGIVPVR